MICILYIAMAVSSRKFPQIQQDGAKSFDNFGQLATLLNASTCGII